jgi:tRNA A-37 threonylcarbamoyl transferase component Bud32
MTKTPKQHESDRPHGLDPERLYDLAKPQSSSAGGPALMPAPSIEEIGRQFPELILLDLIGQGGMGAVYKAIQPKLDRTVALKVLLAKRTGDPAFAERFAREARALARLDHPHIVRIYDFGERGELFFLLIEYVDGMNLRELMRMGQMTPGEALGIVPQLCDALHYAHREGVVHRDIKPENILVDQNGKAHIADFGLAKLSDAKGMNPTLTHAHQVMGTLHYMAPEQVEQPLQVDHRADIFSLGVVLYEMLTGQLPLGRFSPPSISSVVGQRVDEAVMRSLERNPDARFQDAAEFKDEVGCEPGAPSHGDGSESAPRYAPQFNKSVAAYAVAILVWGASRLYYVRDLQGPLVRHGMQQPAGGGLGDVAIGISLVLLIVGAIAAMRGVTAIHRSGGKLKGIRLGLVLAGAPFFTGLCAVAYGLADRFVDPGIAPIAQLVMIPVLMAGFGWAVQFSVRWYNDHPA